MTSRRFSLLAIALAAGLFATQGASAATLPVTYTTFGTFDSGVFAGSNVYDDGAGVRITFEEIVSQTVNVTVPTPGVSGLSFGNFNTSLTTASSLQGVASGFQIEIFQADPGPTTPGSLILVGTLTGQLAATESTAYVQFTGFTPANLPTLGQAGYIGTLATPEWFVDYYITEADNLTLGKANIVPPSVNNGISSVEGAVRATLVPEPSTLALAGLGLAPAALLIVRRKRIATA